MTTEIINLLTESDGGYGFKKNKVFNFDLANQSRKNIGHSEKMESDLIAAVSAAKQKLQTATNYKGFEKSKKVIDAINRNRDKMLHNFVPLLKSEHNKVFSILKILASIDRRCDFSEVRDSFATLTNLKYLKPYEQRVLKNFNMLRNMLIHQEMNNVFKADHWREMNEMFTSLYNIMDRILNDFELTIFKKIEVANVRFKYDSGYNELNKWIDKQMQIREMSSMVLDI
jgi:hypothetical protein